MKFVVKAVASLIVIGAIGVFTANTLYKMTAINDAQRECQHNLNRILSIADLKENSVRVVVMPESMFNSLFAEAVLVEQEGAYVTLSTPDGWYFKADGFETE